MKILKKSAILAALLLLATACYHTDEKSEKCDPSKCITIEVTNVPNDTFAFAEYSSNDHLTQNHEYATSVVLFKSEVHFDALVYFYRNEELKKELRIDTASLPLSPPFTYTISYKDLANYGEN